MMKFNLDIVALIFFSLSPIALAVPDFFDIDPITLIIDNSTLLNETIFVKLKSKPADLVKARVTGNDLLTFSTCELVFGPDDYERERRLIVGSTSSEPRNEFSKTGIFFLLAASYPANLNSIENSQKVVVKSRGPVSGQCSTAEKSSFRTFDGQIVKLQDEGTFYFVRSFDLIIQIFQEICDEGVCVKRVALLHKKKGLAIVDLDSKNQSAAISLYGDSSSINIRNLDNSQSRIEFDDGAFAAIKVGPVKVDISVTVPNSYIGHTAGICGNFDGIGSTDLVDGSSLSAASAVPNDENLFEACCFNGKEDVPSLGRLVRKLIILESMREGKFKNGPTIGKLQKCPTENLALPTEESTQNSLSSNALIITQLTPLYHLLGVSVLNILLQ